jgi:hypothetical protein
VRGDGETAPSVGTAKSEPIITRPSPYGIGLPRSLTGTVSLEEF